MSSDDEEVIGFTPSLTHWPKYPHMFLLIILELLDIIIMRSRKKKHQEHISKGEIELTDTRRCLAAATLLLFLLLVLLPSLLGTSGKRVCPRRYVITL
jgi:hypothetical protein